MNYCSWLKYEITWHKFIASPQKWKVLGSSPGWVNTFQKCGMGWLAVRVSAVKVEGPGFKSRLGQNFSKGWYGLIDMWHPGTMHSVKGWYDSVRLCCKIYARQDVLMHPASLVLMVFFEVHLKPIWTQLSNILVRVVLVPPQGSCLLLGA